MDLDNKIDRKYFLQYQKDAIMTTCRLLLWEKSIRIGATFAMAFRAVRNRIRTKRNYLHTSVNERIAKSFIGDCQKFCRIIDVVGASEVKEFETWNKQENRSETAFEITFKNQECAIKAFSSNPDAIRGEGGDVGIDELSSHKQPDEMVKAAGGRAMWGDSLAIWTSHKGVNSAFNRKLKEERAKGEESRFTIMRTTLLDAIALGLLDKINEVSGQNMSEEDFIADTKALVGGDAAYNEECLCDPRAEGAQAIKWGYIDAAKRDYVILRKDIEGDEPFDIEAWLASLLPVLNIADAVAVGYDVARTGHLSSVPIIARFGDDWKLMALITMHKRKFGLQRDVLAGIMRSVPTCLGGGDKTGLGMQVCEELTDLFTEYRFTGMNFGTLKTDLGTKLVRVFEDNRFHLPAARDQEDIQFDLAAITTGNLPSGRAVFMESINPINKLSHCDIAWAIAMAVYVGDETEKEQRFI